MSADGHLFVSHAAAFTSIFFYSANPFVPESARISAAPAAGVSAVVPVSFLEQTTSGLVWVHELINSALDDLAQSTGASALPASRRAMVQLGATAASFFDAQAAGEIRSSEATTRSAITTTGA